MTVFHYIAVDIKGHTRKGVLEGDSSAQIREKLREMGLTPLEIKLAEVKKIHRTPLRFLTRKKHINTATLALITYQFGTLLSAGLPIEAALLNIAEQMEKTPLKTILLRVRARVLEGHSLAYGMNDFPHIFPKLYRATLAAGEKSGQLENVMNQLAVYLEQQQNIKQKIQQALIYPALLTTVSIAIIIFLLTYAMPKIISVFNQNGQTLPQLTIWLIALSQGLKIYGPYCLIIFIISIVIFKKLLKKRQFQYKFHQFILKLPFLSKTIIIINAARFARTFGILFAAGVPVLEAMHTANSVVTLLPMQQAIEQAIKRVSEGSSIHQALYQTNYFTKLSTQLIASGETSGKLEFMLEKTASYQEQNMIRWMTTALALFEPFLILVMGILVLFIVLAILLPIFDMNDFFN